MREQGLRLVLGRARVGVGHRMAERCGIETMQSGLRDYHWPVRMALPRFSEGAQHLLLNRIGHLHYREDEMRLPLTPGDVAQRIVVRFTEPTRVEKAQQRRLAWEVIKRRGTCAGLEALPDLGALITREAGDDGRLAGSGLAQEPDDQCGRAGAFSRALLANCSS